MNSFSVGKIRVKEPEGAAFILFWIVYKEGAGRFVPCVPPLLFWSLSLLGIPSSLNFVESGNSEK